MKLMGSEEFATSWTFGGRVVRTMYRRGRSLGQIFTWAELDADFSVNAGEQVVDAYDFRDAEKMGPTVIYDRLLPVAGPTEARSYFGGNTAVISDTARRSRIEADTTFVWPTDEEAIRGFRQVYGSTFLESHFGPRDIAWDSAAERNFYWMTLRVVAVQETSFHELLVWLPSRPGITDEERRASTNEYLQSLGLVAVPGLIEIFETHLLRPQPGMCLFRIAKVSRPSESEFRRENFF